MPNRGGGEFGTLGANASVGAMGAPFKCPTFTRIVRQGVNSRTLDTAGSSLENEAEPG
jgi:hypothetical protein